jgi:hypothetical protein
MKSSMKKSVFLAIALALFTTGNLSAQKKAYISTGGEMIFSFANVEYNVEGTSYTSGNIMRWAPVLNQQVMFNFDPAKAFGIFTGLGVRNVGFILSRATTDIKYKYRTYNLGLPVGFKIGSMKGFFVYAGYEIEYAFNYKEKMFVNNDKESVDVYWFTERVEQFPQSVLVGINFPYGFNLKFKYYLTNFHNEEFATMVDGVEVKPYEGLKSNVFYVSLNFGLFNRAKSMTNPGDWR